MVKSGVGARFVTDERLEVKDVLKMEVLIVLAEVVEVLEACARVLDVPGDELVAEGEAGHESPLLQPED